MAVKSLGISVSTSGDEDIIDLTPIPMNGTYQRAWGDGNGYAREK